MGEFFSGTKKVWNGMDMVPDRRKQTRRQHPRFQVNLDTVVQIDNVSYQCTMLDISKTGCRVMSEKPIQNVSREVIVKFMAPKQLDYTFATGKIKWIHLAEKSCLIGIAFGKSIPNFEDLMG